MIGEDWPEPWQPEHRPPVDRDYSAARGPTVAADVPLPCQAQPDLFVDRHESDGRRGQDTNRARWERHSRAIALCATCRELDRCAPTVNEFGQPDAGVFGGQSYPLDGSRGRRRRPAPPREHGTEKGVRQHRHYGEPVCDECTPALDAINARTRERWAQRKAE